MAEYIERAAVIKLITGRYENPEICEREIAEIPAADVAPVLHGRWIEKDDDLHCSECGHQIPDCAGNATVILTTENRFCYFCGAKMDGGVTP